MVLISRSAVHWTLAQCIVGAVQLSVNVFSEAMPSFKHAVIVYVTVTGGCTSFIFLIYLSFSSCCHYYLSESLSVGFPFFESPFYRHIGAFTKSEVIRGGLSDNG